MNTAGIQKTALVTGTGSGIGQAVALAIQSAGYSVIAAGRRLAELEKTVVAASSSGNQILPVPTDVSKPDSVRAILGPIRETFGRLDVLFNNAARSAPAVPMEVLSYEEWTAVVPST